VGAPGTAVEFESTLSPPSAPLSALVPSTDGGDPGDEAAGDIFFSLIVPVFGGLVPMGGLFGVVPTPMATNILAADEGWLGLQAPAIAHSALGDPGSFVFFILSAASPSLAPLTTNDILVSTAPAPGFAFALYAGAAALGLLPTDELDALDIGYAFPCHVDDVFVDSDDDGVGNACENCPYTFGMVLLSDIDRSGNSSFHDYARLAIRWLETCDDSNWCDDADLDKSGEVDPNDLRILGDEWLLECLYHPPPCIDGDQDGYGDPGNPLCTNPEKDCDDGNANVNPRADEQCSNGIDDNCNGLTDGNDPACQYPACWGNPRQCHGDTDGLLEGSSFSGYYYVGDIDLGILTAAYGTHEGEPEYEPCADMDNDGDVDAQDLAELNTWYKVKEEPHGPGVPADCTPGP